MCGECVEPPSFPCYLIFSVSERQRDSQRPNMSQPGPSPLRQEEKSLSVQESLSEISDSDVAKFPALFGVRTIIKTDPEEARSQLIEARL